MKAWESNIFDEARDVYYPFVRAKRRQYSTDHCKPTVEGIEGYEKFKTECQRAGLDEIIALKAEADRTCAPVSNPVRDLESVLNKISAKKLKAVNQTEFAKLERILNCLRTGGSEADARSRYVSVLRAFDFFEDMAVLVNRGYVRSEDVIDLFGFHIRVFDAFAGGLVSDDEICRAKRDRWIAENREPRFQGGNMYSNYVHFVRRVYWRLPSNWASR